MEDSVKRKMAAGRQCCHIRNFNFSLFTFYVFKTIDILDIEHVKNIIYEQDNKTKISLSFSGNINEFFY